jgi:hypothetical protein
VDSDRPPPDHRAAVEALADGERLDVGLMTVLNRRRRVMAWLLVAAARPHTFLF